MAKRALEDGDSQDNVVDLSETFFGYLGNHGDDTNNDRKNKEEVEMKSDLSLSRQQLVTEQERDNDIKLLKDKALSKDELDKIPVGYYVNDGVLMRKWRPLEAPANEEWAAVHQVVVPKVYRNEILHLAHKVPMGGHLGINKTMDKILKHFFWPGMRKDVSEYCKSCHTCQVVGKPNNVTPVAPLQPIPAFGEPFSKIVIDCVGPLPVTKSGNQYLLTIMCAATRFPEAIPLRNIKAPTISKALLKFFTLVGLPKEVQSDQGSNFMSGLFQQIMYHLGTKQIKSSAYHPESQGALERFHSTLKTMMKTYCHDNQKDWDEGIPLLLFAVRESVQESLGFSPFELVFGHRVRGPLSLVKEQWIDDNTKLNLLDYVSKFKERLYQVCAMAKNNLKASQTKMKVWYDKKARTREFKPGDLVLVLFPTQDNPLHVKFSGPYEILKKVNEVDYVVKTPDRRRPTQLCHINMLKPYYQEEKTVNLVNVCHESTETSDEPHFKGKDIIKPKLNNSDVLNNLDEKLNHLDFPKRQELKDLIFKYKELFPDVPRRTNVVQHDVDVGDTRPIKQHPYRLNPVKSELMEKEIQYMLENDIIRPSQSNWSSPCVMVPKPDGSVRFCTDYRKVNAVTKTDSYPIPRVDDCIDKIGKAKYVTKIDLLKGYWGVPLTDRAREISAFVTPTGLYEYNVMPFGMKNAPATFQRMVDKTIRGLDSSDSYIDDIITADDWWTAHLIAMEMLFQRLLAVNLTVNLTKCEFGQATVTFLSHKVGQGHVAPVEAKVVAIVEYPVPTNKKSLMRFLGMAGFYRKFCKNFSEVASPLTELLKKDKKFVWNASCQRSFEGLKAILQNAPVLKAPDFTKAFALAVDASDNAAGAVLLQEGDDDGIEHPVTAKLYQDTKEKYKFIEMFVATGAECWL
ncbi:uncharacterized protein [Ptychodera flava]|uniref:uncharacterized protein n=1 Tax=Ptychodera flava TaxID=63121 RepID=UPI00396AAA38